MLSGLEGDGQVFSRVRKEVQAPNERTSTGDETAGVCYWGVRRCEEEFQRVLGTVFLETVFTCSVDYQRSVWLKGKEQLRSGRAFT